MKALFSILTIGLAVSMFGQQAFADSGPAWASVPELRFENDSGSKPNLVDLWAYASDDTTQRQNLIFSITSQSNPNLIYCFIEASRYVSCAAPSSSQTGTNTITV